jgi:hypothetical protein
LRVKRLKAIGYVSNVKRQQHQTQDGTGKTGSLPVEKFFAIGM